MLLNLEKIFLCLREANLKINPKKCVSFNKKIKYLGHNSGGHFYRSRENKCCEGLTNPSK